MKRPLVVRAPFSTKLPENVLSDVNDDQEPIEIEVRLQSVQKPIGWVEEYRLQAENETKRLQRLFTQVFQGDVQVSVSNDCDIVQMTMYKGVDAKIPQGKIVSHFIIGDGNCGFRSISYCLFEDQELHYSIRTAACNAIKGNATSFINKVEGLNSTGTNDTANQTVLEYLADKTKVSEHAGQIERWCDQNLLEGTALAYSTQIRIYTQYNGENVLLVLDPMNVTAGKSIAIVQNGGHYEVLLDDFESFNSFGESFELSEFSDSKSVALTIESSNNDLEMVFDRPINLPRESAWFTDQVVTLSETGQLKVDGELKGQWDAETMTQIKTLKKTLKIDTSKILVQDEGYLIVNGDGLHCLIQ